MKRDVGLRIRLDRELRDKFVAACLWMNLFNGGASRLPAAAPAWEKLLSRIAHAGLYGGILAIVLTGLSIPLAQNTGSPALLDAAVGVHEFTTNFVLALIAADVLAALWHRIVRNHRVWEAISAPAIPGLAFVERRLGRVPASCAEFLDRAIPPCGRAIGSVIARAWSPAIRQ